jgi:putative transposase
MEPRHHGVASPWSPGSSDPGYAQLGTCLAIALDPMLHPHRLDPSAYVGVHRYFLTFCTDRRRCYFTDPRIVESTALQIHQSASREGFQILAYCFMPDHLHAVVTAQSHAADVQRFARLAKQRSGFQFACAGGRRLWQKSYFDRTLRSDEDLAAVIRYVIENPVRAGLATVPAEYPHWGSQTYTREEILEFVARGQC